MYTEASHARILVSYLVVVCTDLLIVEKITSQRFLSNRHHHASLFFFVILQRLLFCRKNTLTVRLVAYGLLNQAHTLTHIQLRY